MESMLQNGMFKGKGQY